MRARSTRSRRDPRASSTALCASSLADVRRERRLARPELSQLGELREVLRDERGALRREVEQRGAIAIEVLQGLAQPGQLVVLLGGSRSEAPLELVDLEVEVLALALASADL